MDIYGVNATVKQQGPSGRSPDSATGDSATGDTAANAFSDFLSLASSMAAQTDPSAQMTNALVKSMNTSRSQRDEARPRDDTRDITDTADKDAKTAEVEDTSAEDREDTVDKTDDAPAEKKDTDASSPDEATTQTVSPDKPAVPGQDVKADDGQTGPAPAEQETSKTEAPAQDDAGTETGTRQDTPQNVTVDGDAPQTTTPHVEAASQTGQPARVQTPTATAGDTPANVAAIAASAAKAGHTDTSGAALKTGMQQPTASTTTPVTENASGKPHTAAQAQTQTANPAQAAPQQATTGKAAGDRSATTQAQADGIAQRIGEAGEGRTLRVQVASQGQATTQGDVQRHAQQAQSQSDPATTGAAARAAAYYAGTTATGGNAGQSQQKGSLGQQAAQHMAETKADASPQQTPAGQAQQTFQAQVKAASSGAENPGRGTPQVTSATSTTGTGTGMTSTATSADGLQTGQGQPGQQGQQTQQTAQAHHSQPSSRSAAQTQVAEQVKVKIAQNAATGQDTIKIQLKPADLGRVDVKLHMHDGRVTAHVVADHRETLDMLKADSRGLEQALKDAGLKPDSGSLSFSLRGDGNPQLAQNGNQGGGRDRGPANPYGAKAQSLDDDLGPIDVEMARSHAATARGGVDVRV